VTVPHGVGTAIVGAIIAAAGYVGKLLVDVVLDFRKRKRDRRSQLVELRSLLRAAKTSFTIQNQHATRLLNMLRRSDSQPLTEAVGYERIFASKYAAFSPEEKELHDIIRGITIHALKPTNTELLNWIQRDSYFRGQRKSEEQIGSLPECLSDLHTHLLLWLAKYETWIPDQPEHALIYLDDEQKHGVEFPKRVDAIVERVLAGM
jgi:hypothetical protein